MHTPLHDVAAAIIVVGIVVGIVRVVPIVVAGTIETEAAREEPAATAMEPVVKAVVTGATEISVGVGKSIALNRTDVAGSRRARQAVTEVAATEVAAIDTSRGEVATAEASGVHAAATETTGVRSAEAATAAKSAAVPATEATSTTETTTSTAVAASPSAAASAGQSHVRRQRHY